MKKKICVFLLRLAAAFLILSISFLQNANAQEKVNMTLMYDGQTRNYSADAINLVINGEKITGLSMPPIIFNDYTLVPARDVLEFMGAAVSWKPETSEVVIQMGKNNIFLKINNTTARINDVDKIMDIPPKIINDKTMIPLRFVADNLNFLVFWDEFSKTIYIDDMSFGQNTGEELDITSSEDFGYIVDTSNDDTQSANIDININSNTSMSESDTLIPARDKSTSKISFENHPETKIKEIIQPQNGDNYFKITAESSISKVEKNLLGDNRMYLDIYGAVLDVSQSSYSFADNPDVASVRAAQNQIDPEKIVRVVFDLKDGTEYFVDLSSDRKTITVGFERNKIKDFNFKSDYSMDIFTLVGVSTPSVNVYLMENPDRLVIDVPYADMEKIEEKLLVAGEFTNAVHSMQFDANTARITLDLNRKVSYSISTENNTAVITLFSPTYKNIDYDITNKRIILSKKAGQSINIHEFIHKDDYSSFKYIITIPGDFSEHFGQGDHIIRDSYLNSVSVRTHNGQTSIIINEAQVLAYNVYEDSSYIYIQPVRPKEKYDKIVVIDPGHGGDAPGTSGNGLVERNVNLDIAKRLHELLERDGRVKVYSTRLTDVNPSFEERAQFGTNNGDLFVSIHNNAAEIRPSVPNTTVNGTETFYYHHENDLSIGFTSQQAAAILHKKMISTLKSNDREIKANNYLVLTLTRVPAILCEIGFFTNSEEAAKLATDEYRQRAAQGLFEGIIDIFEQYKPKR